MKYPKLVYVFACGATHEYRPPGHDPAPTGKVRWSIRRQRWEPNPDYVPKETYNVTGFSLDPSGLNLPEVSGDWILRNTIQPHKSWQYDIAQPLGQAEATDVIATALDTNGWYIGYVYASRMRELGDTYRPPRWSNRTRRSAPVPPPTPAAAPPPPSPPTLPDISEAALDVLSQIIKKAK